MPRALVVGCDGQDGTYLTEGLTQKNYEVTGVGRPGTFAKADVADRSQVYDLLVAQKPSEIYFLAAYHHATEELADSGKLVPESFAINTLALDNFLHALALTGSKAGLFYAASSLVFAGAEVSPQDETTPMVPTTPYGIAKAAGVHLCRYYRSQGVRCCAGFLYNHESPLRKPHFLTRKVAAAVARIECGLQSNLVVGNLSAQVDWGYAPDYTEAMWRMLQLEQPEDLIIASGTLHTVRDFVDAAFQVVGLPWQDHVTEDRSLLKQNRAETVLVGNPQRISQRTGWNHNAHLKKW